MYTEMLWAIDARANRELGESRLRISVPSIAGAFIRREILEISGDRISKEHALILTDRESGKMTAADVSRHARGPRLASPRNLAPDYSALKRDGHQRNHGMGLRDQVRALQFTTT
jgi:hypothetical protein